MAGFTFVQASIRSGGKVVPLVQREEDEKFRSVFISADPAIRALADLKGQDCELWLAIQHLGTHLMPRSYLLQAQIDPDKGFQTRGLLGRTRRHHCRRGLGQGGRGRAQHFGVGEKFVADKKVDTGKVKVIFTTPAYFDYNWTVHSDMPVAQREKLTKAFSRPEPQHPRGQGNSGPAARHALHSHPGQQLQGHRNRSAQRGPDQVNGYLLLFLIAACAFAISAAA